MRVWAGLVLACGLACTGGAGDEAETAPAAPAPAPAATAPASEGATAKAGGRKARGRGKSGGAAGSCCEEGPGHNGLPVDATLFEDIDQGECTTKGGAWVTKPECEPVCCAVGDGSDTEPVPEWIPKGSCKMLYLGWAGQERPADQCR